MTDANGQGKSRLDRIEEIIERQERANEAAHERFEAEDKRLLSAQILMNDAMKKTNIAIEKMAEGMVSLELTMEASTAKFNALMEETTGKLNALIDTVDGIIRNKGTL